MTYNVFCGTLNLDISIYVVQVTQCYTFTNERFGLDEAGIATTMKRARRVDTDRVHTYGSVQTFIYICTSSQTTPSLYITNYHSTKLLTSTRILRYSLQYFLYILYTANNAENGNHFI